MTVKPQSRKETIENYVFRPKILLEWEYRYTSMNILKLHPLPAICESFVTLSRATYDWWVRENNKKRKRQSAEKDIRLLQSVSRIR